MVLILESFIEVVYEGDSAPEVMGQFTGYTRIRLIEKHRQAHPTRGGSGKGGGKGRCDEIREDENHEDGDTIGEGTVRLDDAGVIIEGHVEAISPKNSSNERAKKFFRCTHAKVGGDGVMACDESGIIQDVQHNTGVVVVHPDGRCEVQGGDIKSLTHDDVAKVVARQKLFAKKRMDRHQQGRILSVDNRNKIIIESVLAVSDAGEIRIETHEERKNRAHQKFEHIVASRRCPPRNINGKAYVVGEEGTILDEVSQDLVGDAAAVN